MSKNVFLTPELDAYISTEVASGRFQNASEVVRAALRLMADYEVRLVPRQTPRLRPERVSPQTKGGARRREWRHTTSRTVSTRLVGSASCGPALGSGPINRLRRLGGV